MKLLRVQSVFILAICLLFETTRGQGSFMADLFSLSPADEKSPLVNNANFISDNDACGNNYRIIGGHPVSIKDVPFIVALFENDGRSCGGSIIHERFVLTAAHCIARDNKNKYKVLIGSDQLSTGSVFVDVELNLCHEDFNLERGWENDICLLKLTEPLFFGCKVAKVDLPDEDFEIEEGLMVNVTGWGNIKTYGVQYPNHLRQTMVPLVSDDCCESLYHHKISDKMFCAGSWRHDSCKGDSGGPLSYNNTQIGIVSFGDGCGIVAGVYTKVSEYLIWINTTIEENL